MLKAEEKKGKEKKRCDGPSIFESIFMLLASLGSAAAPIARARKMCRLTTAVKRIVLKLISLQVGVFAQSGDSL